MLLEAATYKTGVTHVKISEPEEFMLCKYFYSSTIQVSGADSGTRILDKDDYEWQADMHANYPSMIRVLTEKWPHLKPTPERIHGMASQRSVCPSGEV